MNSAPGDGIVILTVLVAVALLVLGIMVFLAPLLIYRRLGETNDLLRYLADHAYRQQTHGTSSSNDFSKTGEMVLPARPGDSSPTFRPLK